MPFFKGECSWVVPWTFALTPHVIIQVELLCNMVVSEENMNLVNKDSARSFVLTCLRSGVRLDLKPRKSTTGLVAHVRTMRC